MKFGVILTINFLAVHGVRRRLALCTIFTILLTHWNSEQKNRLLIKLFFIFHLILMKLGEIVVHMDNYNFTKFHQNQMKNKKVLLIARFSVQNFKVSVELWKSYIVEKSSWKVFSFPVQSVYSNKFLCSLFKKKIIISKCQ